MKFNSPESISILEGALQREKETGAFYQDCILKSKNPGTISILNGLVADEKRHADIVAGLIEQARRDTPPEKFDAAGSQDAKSQLEATFKHIAINDPSFQAESADVRQMLEKALANERESFDTYAGAADDAEDSEVRAIYTYLARQENKHYQLISNLMSYLDDPGKWLYDEENLVFRRG